ncbi:charged multivesicular body protein 2b [Agrilus planipennis]|uniref:Charged multivesicular body protein 2b n=1 Tax=Agrilus planipennis TaxID=224129 RepID=A0A1W4WUB9_AGRPL|nr:charged multivesicular body protein 2b [Agrilus planipennis]
MFSWFDSKPDPKEEQRKIDRELRKVERDMERDRRKLEFEEKKLEQEIKKAAKEGNNDACKSLALQLVQLRKQKTRSYAASGKIKSVGYQNKAMGANLKLAGAMNVAGKTMSDMNKIMKPEQIAANVNAFSREAMKMDMTEEMINDTLDDILDDSDDEKESANIINSVLDEIGIEISGKMRQAPEPSSDRIGGTSKDKSRDISDEELMAQLAKLRG